MQDSEFRFVEAVRRRRELGIETVFPPALLKLLSTATSLPFPSLFVPHTGTEINSIFDDVHGYLRSLWADYIGCPRCVEVLDYMNRFESVLFHGLRYRDHLIHQYLVFLAGLPVLIRFSERIQACIPGDHADVWKSWCMAATYHDIAYPMQLAEYWFHVFCQRLLDIEQPITDFNMSSVLLEKEYLHAMLEISKHAVNQLGGAVVRISEDVIWKLLFQELLARNHGVLSSLILYNRLYESYAAPSRGSHVRTVLEDVVIPAVTAVALHDSAVWHDSSVPNLHFERAPLTFLLIYCDTLQEWGRPFHYKRPPLSPEIPRLSTYTVENNCVSATLTYDIVETLSSRDGSALTAFDKKVDELDRVFAKLRSNEVVFEIVLESMDPKFRRQPVRRATDGH